MALRAIAAGDRLARSAAADRELSPPPDVDLPDRDARRSADSLFRAYLLSRLAAQVSLGERAGLLNRVDADDERMLAAAALGWDGAKGLILTRGAVEARLRVLLDEDEATAARSGGARANPGVGLAIPPTADGVVGGRIRVGRRGARGARGAAPSVEPAGEPTWIASAPSPSPALGLVCRARGRHGEPRRMGTTIGAPFLLVPEVSGPHPRPCEPGHDPRAASRCVRLDPERQGDPGTRAAGHGEGRPRPGGAHRARRARRRSLP